MYKGVNLSEIFRVTAFYSAFSADFSSTYSFKGEYHNFYELVFVTKGAIGVAAGNDIYILNKGQAIIHEPMEFHSLWSENNMNSSVIVISFGADNLPEYSAKVFNIDEEDDFKGVFSLISSAFVINKDYVVDVNEASGNMYIMAVKAFEMFMLKMISRNPGKRSRVESESAEKFSKIISALENNIHKNLLVSDIAEMCNMSESSVKKTFSRYMGTGIMYHFNKLKVTAAISMLENGMSVCEISNALGFQHQNYFSTVFKRITGHSPTVYRNTKMWG